MNRTEEEVHTELVNDLRTIIAKAFEVITLPSLDEAALAVRFNQIYLQSLSIENSSWRTTAGDFLKSIHGIQINFAAARQEQLSNIEELRGGALRYFTDPTRNLSLLTEVALRIKERAIEPSFKLLDATREQLLAVKEEVTTVSFN